MENQSPTTQAATSSNASQNTPPPAAPPASGLEEETSSPNRLFIIIGVVVGCIVVLLIALFIFFKIFSSKTENVTLKYWGLWEDKAVFQGVIDDFHRLHPNITVQYEKQDIKGLGKYIDRLKTRIGNGGAAEDVPDIFRYHNSWLPQIHDVLLPFSSDFINKTELSTAYYPVVQHDLKRNGAYFGIPLEIDTLALFTNDNLFQAVGLKPPSVWNDVASNAATLTVEQQDPSSSSDNPTVTIQTSGIGMQGFDNIAHAPDILSGLLIQNKADLLNLSGPNRKSAADGLDFYTCVQRDNNHCGKFWDPNGDNSLLAFAKGNLAMFFGYSWDIPMIKASNPNLTFSVHPFPHLPADKSLTIASYWVEGIAVKTKHPKESEMFLEYLSQKEVLEKLYAEETKQRGFGELYPRRDMAGLLGNSLVAPFLTQAPDATSTLYSSDTYDDALDSALIQYMGNAVRSVLNGGSADSAIDPWNTGVQTNLKNVQ